MLRIVPQNTLESVARPQQWPNAGNNPSVTIENIHRQRCEQSLHRHRQIVLLSYLLT